VLLIQKLPRQFQTNWWTVIALIRLGAIVSYFCCWLDIVRGLQWKSVLINILLLLLHCCVLFAPDTIINALTTLSSRPQWLPRSLKLTQIPAGTRYLQWKSLIWGLKKRRRLKYLARFSCDIVLNDSVRIIIAVWVFSLIKSFSE
jgi:hypothetical protein